MVGPKLSRTRGTSQAGVRSRARKFIETGGAFRVFDIEVEIAARYVNRHELATRGAKGRHRAIIACADIGVGFRIDQSRNVSDAAAAEFVIAVPRESNALRDSEVHTVRSGDRMQHDRTILGMTAHRSDLVQRPSRSHDAIAADASERRPQSDQAASR